MMLQWKITWYDGSRLRVTMVQSDAYNLMLTASSAGIYNPNSIIKIEQVATP